jgi:hypothetical protein
LKNNKSEDNDKNSPIDVQKLTRHSISVLPPPPAIVEAPPREVHPVVIDYKPPAPVPAAASSAPAVRQTTYLPKLLNGNGLSGPPMAPLCAMFTDDGDVI